MYIGGAIPCSLLLMSYYDNSMVLRYFQLLGLGRHIFLEIVICLILNALRITSKMYLHFRIKQFTYLNIGLPHSFSTSTV